MTTQNLQRFLNAPLHARQAEVETPELAGLIFDEGTPAVWTVRGLTAAEMGRAKQATDTGRERVLAIIEALAGDGDKAAHIRKAFGLGGDDVPDFVSLNTELIMAGSVFPPIGPEYRDAVVKLSEAFPMVFNRLASKIIDLTSQGAELGKPVTSGKTPASVPH